MGVIILEESPSHPVNLMAHKYIWFSSLHPKGKPVNWQILLLVSFIFEEAHKHGKEKSER